MQNSMKIYAYACHNLQHVVQTLEAHTYIQYKLNTWHTEKVKRKLGG